MSCEDVCSVPASAAGTAAEPGVRLRLLSYNIQTGIDTRRYRQYLTQSWKHVLPFPARLDNLDVIARLIADYDLIGVQEADAGSIRSGYINQIEYLALRARLPYWYDQTNRRVGQFARHSLGLLSRYPAEVHEHRLPGAIPGRGALMARFGADALVVLIVHLALGRRARVRQLAYLSDLVNSYRHVVLMGDLNCRADSQEMDFFIRSTLLREPTQGLPTFPSWRPQRNIDHILVTPNLHVDSVRVINFSVSDHLPVCMELRLPDGLALPG